MKTAIIGIDCAAQPKDMGLALGIFDGRTTEIKQATAGFKTRNDILETVSAWMQGSRRTLLALDAPLGWPKDMSRSLIGHEAGKPLQATADSMFHRETDRAVRDITGRLPLEVGANLIARTAHAALEFLHELGDRTRQPICLAWNPASQSGLIVIEVYPAATLHAHGIHRVREPSYKKGKAGWQDVLGTIAERLSERTGLRLPDDVRDSIVDDDALDAVVCVLAATDFLGGAALQPTAQQLETARREGWIWVKKPG